MNVSRRDTNIDGLDTRSIALSVSAHDPEEPHQMDGWKQAFQAFLV